MKHSDQLIDWLCELGYTHCFFVPGGAVMHVINSADERLTTFGFVHEVAAVIAAEYFNALSEDGKAFALVTAGPGLTNAVTGIAGAFLESRELLILGGQVKTADLAHGRLRQRGIQELDGRSVVEPICKLSVRLDAPVSKAVFQGYVREAAAGRPGPVFIELPLDVQGAPVEGDAPVGPATGVREARDLPQPDESDLAALTALLAKAERPLIVLGGGVSSAAAERLSPALERLGVPLTTTWNGADRLPSDHPLYFGRPNTWGMRYSNILLQQADLVVALGSRLGLQQTGFNWQQFAPLAKVVQVDVDPAELDKGHPRVDLAIVGDADVVLAHVAAAAGGRWGEWLGFCREVREALPLVEPLNETGEGFVSPYDFVSHLSAIADEGDVIIPCSSGGAFTVMMQVFAQKRGQRILTNHGLASMGYGLSGAIGAAVAHPNRRVILTEGDGGFAQNLQELGTVAVSAMRMKIFIYDDHGYASIRATQKNYFAGKYFGCDRETGLGLPDWEALFAAYRVPVMRVTPQTLGSPEFTALFEAAGPAGFILSIDPSQTYWPKIMSRITPSGSMESAPLHQLSPDLPEKTARKVFRWL